MENAVKLKFINDCINICSILDKGLARKADSKLYNIINILFTYINYIANLPILTTEKLEIIAKIKNAYSCLGNDFMTKYATMYVQQENINTTTQNIYFQLELTNKMKAMFEANKNAIIKNLPEPEKCDIIFQIMSNNMAIFYLNNMIARIKECDELRKSANITPFYLDYVSNILQDIALNVQIQMSTEFGNAVPNSPQMNYLDQYFNYDESNKMVSPRHKIEYINSLYQKILNKEIIEKNALDILSYYMAGELPFKS